MRLQPRSSDDDVYSDDTASSQPFESKMQHPGMVYANSKVPSLEREFVDFDSLPVVDHKRFRITLPILRYSPYGYAWKYMKVIIVYELNRKNILQLHRI